MRTCLGRWGFGGESLNVAPNVAPDVLFYGAPLRDLNPQPSDPKCDALPRFPPALSTITSSEVHENARNGMRDEATLPQRCPRIMRQSRP
jgi:hypothetical protein